jgi:hypothetical protein
VDIILLVYAESPETLDGRYRRLQRGFAAGWHRLFDTLPTQVLSQQKEHFGFHDGISSPSSRVEARQPRPAAATS